MNAQQMESLDITPSQVRWLETRGFVLREEDGQVDWVRGGVVVVTPAGGGYWHGPAVKWAPSPAVALGGDDLVAAIADRIPSGLSGEARHIAAIEAFGSVTGCFPSEAEDTDAAWVVVEKAAALEGAR